MTLVETDTIFGRIVSGSDVEDWCIDQARTWFGTYLSEMERQHGIAAGTFARPRGYVRTISFDKWPEDQLPALMFVSYGIVAPPARRGDGTYDARWLMGLGTLCTAKTQQDTHEMALLYTAALRELFIEKPSLGGRTAGLDWLEERYDDLAYDDVRSLSTGQARFAVEVRNVAQAGVGPRTPDVPLVPDTDPWPGWPTVQLVDVDIANEGG